MQDGLLFAVSDVLELGKGLVKMQTKRKLFCVIHIQQVFQAYDIFNLIAKNYRSLSCRLHALPRKPSTVSFPLTSTASVLYLHEVRVEMKVCGERSQMPSINLKLFWTLNPVQSVLTLSLKPVFSLAVCRSVCGLIPTQVFGVRSSRLFVLSASRCGTFTITASFSQLETDEMPSSWRRSACFESFPSPWRRECPTWRCCSEY